MLRNQLYYRIKPLLPWSVRVAVRRMFAQRKRALLQDDWPVMPGSESPPRNWPGWPDGKKFALVLTHDVEGFTGMSSSRRLMELERDLGFRSSFNFVPEGGYSVPPELRDGLTSNGFEVGVHDLHHDGKLFQNRREFAGKAAHINRYLKDWGAVGFRSAYMLHNLDWFQALDIEYDASTFDTDPFEPQPDHRKTIFPFWVPRNSSHGVPAPTLNGSRGGYVELPYTLPQDSTLFLLFRERTADIWLQKLDWVAKHGGMALVDVHPDYLNWNGHDVRGAYPVAKYVQLLNYVAERYRGEFWHATPREVARWYASATREQRQQEETIPAVSPALAGKRAAAVVYSYYLSDPRPKREAESLAAAGMEVDVLCLRDGRKEPRREASGGISILRMPLRRNRQGKVAYLARYLAFSAFAFGTLSIRSLYRRYDVVHVHNMPDFLVFTAIIPRLLGAKLVLDLHDPVPEVAMTIYKVPAAHPIVRLCRLVERLSLRFAHLALTPNRAFRDLFISRGCPPEKIQIVMNSPQARMFSPARGSARTGAGVVRRPFTVLYHGLLAERQGLETALRAVAQVRSRIPGIKFLIYGAHTPYLESVRQLVRDLELEEAVQYLGFRPLEHIAEAIAASDLGLVPSLPTPFTEINLPTRIFEYLAMEKPVIVPRTRGIQEYFTDDEIIFFKAGDPASLADRIEWAYSHPEEVRELVLKGREVYGRHRWEQEERRFIQLLENLLASPVLGRAASPPKARNVCMITYSHYESDERVMRYAEALARRGDQVDVFALKRDRQQAGVETMNGVDVCRVQCRRGKNQRNKAAFLLPLLRFWLASSIRLTWRHARNRYDLVHVHNVPDFLVFAAWLPKLTGAKVVLDIHDIVPEFYASKFNLPPGSFGVRMLKKVERLAARFASHIIISNHLWLDTFAGRTGAGGKCSVFINNVDPKIFQPRPRTRADGKFIILFPGGLQWHQGLDIALRAFAKISPELPHAEFHIYGDGSMKPSLMALARELGLAVRVRFFDPLPVHDIAEVMANADLGVVPKRADSFGNEAYSTKIMEFMSLGVPVVVSETKIDRFYFNDSVVRFFESGNPDAMAEAMLGVIRDDNRRRRMVARASEYASLNSWESHRDDYLNLVNALCTGETAPCKVSHLPFNTPDGLEQQPTAAIELANGVPDSGIAGHSASPSEKERVDTVEAYD